MIQLLFALLAAEAALALSLLFRTPARRLALLAIDRAKRGRGPVMARTVAATMLLVLASSGYSVAKIRRRAGELGQLTPTDQVLASRHLLEASLMGNATSSLYPLVLFISSMDRDLVGYSLFLGLIIDRLHHYIRELRMMKKNVEAVTKQSRTLEEAKHGGTEEIQGYQKEIASLKEQVQMLKDQSQKKTEELKTAEANSMALQKQSEGLLIEYDRLIAENGDLRNKLQAIDHHVSHSDGKKNS
ncbi:hypothetical protein HU200_053687 [Digitaria exilis]|uniref:Endoplasmic reticulum transmembrane protein n=1 Tax=Digitaria exilis TaxID=1010633 RepID=A0A835AJ08_9POAL|nr:hypothetical protein HU200_053687 [Digitaria exilis]